MRSTFFLSCIFCVTSVLAQSPKGIPYQGIARNASGAEIANTNITVDVSIRQGSTSGTIVFSERHNLNTNQFGLFTLTIGDPSAPDLSGSFNGISWGQGPYFLEVALDPNGGTNTVTIGVTQFWSVPYALYADSARYAPAGPTGAQGPQGNPGAQGPTGVTGATGNSVNWLGSLTLAPVSPNALNAYYNISQGISWIWNGTSWDTLAKNGLPGPPGPMGMTGPTGPTGSFGVTGTTGQTIYHNGANWLATSNLNNNGTNVGIGAQAGLSLLTLGNGPTDEIEFSGLGNSDIKTPNGLNITSGMATRMEASSITLGTGLMDRLHINGAGDVGIGNILPNYKLDVTGTGRFTGQLRIGAYTLPAVDGLPMQVLATNGLGTVTWQTNGGGTVTTVNTGTGLTGGPITSTGTISLSNTSVTAGSYGGPAVIPQITVDAQGRLTSAVNLSISSSLLPTGATGNTLYHNGTNWVASSNIYNNGGNIGMGTTSPGYKLHVSTNTYPGIQVDGTDPSWAGVYVNGVSNTTKPFYGYKLMGTSTAWHYLTATGDWRLWNTGGDWLTVTTGGNVGINQTSPSAKLDVNGSFRMTDGTQGNGKILVSNATGDGKWETASNMISIAPPPCQAMAGANTTPTPFNTSLATFTKNYVSTKLEVIFQTHLSVDDLNGANGVIFELRIDGNPASGNSGKAIYFQDNNFAVTIDMLKQTTIYATFPTLSAGVHNVQLYVYTNAGTASTLMYDNGCWQTSNVTIRETW